MYIYRTSDEFASLLLQFARMHGEESEPDHEVGDLQSFFLACWAVMTPQQRIRALEDPDVQDILSGPDYEDAL